MILFFVEINILCISPTDWGLDPLHQRCTVGLQPFSKHGWITMTDHRSTHLTTTSIATRTVILWSCIIFLQICLYVSRFFQFKKGILVKAQDVILRISFLHDSSISIPPHHGAAWEGNFRSERPIWGHGEGGRCFANGAMKKGAPGCLGVYKGWTPTQLCGDYFINHKYPY